MPTAGAASAWRAPCKRTLFIITWPPEIEILAALRSDRRPCFDESEICKPDMCGAHAGVNTFEAVGVKRGAAAATCFTPLPRRMPMA